MKKTLALTLCGALCIIACSKTPSPTTQPKPADTAKTQETQTSKAAPKNILTAQLIDVEGWQADPAQEIQMQTNGKDMLQIMRTYKNAGKEIGVIIIKGDTSEAFQNPPEGGKIESGDAIIESKVMNGFNTIFSFIKKDNAGALTVLLKDDPKAGIVLNFTFDKVPQDDAIIFAKKFDWATIKSQ